VEDLGLLLLLGVLMLFKVEELTSYTINHLIKLYQEHKENKIAFELFGRYKKSSNREKGEIIWALLAPHTEDLSKIVGMMKEDPQEELQKLYLKLHQLFMQEKFPHSNWKSWLARILKNDLINQKKRKNPIVSVPMERLPEQEVEEENDQMNEKIMYEVIHSLPEKQKKVIELRYLKKEGKLMTYKEIATIMGCSVGQVHGYLDRAKENLRNKMKAANSKEL